MKISSFKVKEFQVPQFEMDYGKMIRFWVQIIPKKENDTNGYWGAERIFEIINKSNNEKKGTKIYLCPQKLKLDLFDFLKPIKVGEYLKNKFSTEHKEIEDKLKPFNIKPEYTLRKMGFTHQKIFSIICGIEKNEITAFDFYGFAPDTEIKLMKYIQTKLEEGKALIGFDNLGYKEDNSDKENIENLIIKRT